MDYKGQSQDKVKAWTFQANAAVCSGAGEGITALLAGCGVMMTCSI